MRLQVGKDFSKILPQDGEKCPVFDLRASKDLLWAVGCDLRGDKDGFIALFCEREIGCPHCSEDTAPNHQADPQH